MNNRFIRYGIVGAGWISQSVFMPGIAHTGNSKMTALVTGSKKKAALLGKKYHIQHICGYDDYSKLLTSGDIDALYIALPNWMHASYAIPALEAGIHVLLEKPMAVSVQECQAISEAAMRGKAKLMIAYRLHCEPGTLATIERVRNGEIGEARYFTAVMGQTVEKANHRARNGFWAGPVADMGPYPINAARNLFECEPVEVMATGVRNPALGFNFDDTVSVTMRFPKERLAQFVVSYGSSAVDIYRIAGSKGDIEVDPGFIWGKPRELRLTKDGKTYREKFAETDHFGGEALYFSNCILTGEPIEPDGEEGLADVRIICAIEQSLASGKPEQLAPYKRAKRPQMSQVVKLPPVPEPELIDAAKPSG